MRKIYKYAISVTDEQVIAIPDGSRILTVQRQRDHVFIWIEIDPEEKQMRTLQVYTVATGASFSGRGIYLGTYQLFGGDLIYHVYVEVQE